MSLRHLKHLLVVAETGSFSRAAERLHLTQSALSRSIQTLEQDLDARLIDRIGRRNELTAVGETVAARARSLLDQFDDLQRCVARLKAGAAGPIRVGLGSGPGAMLMTPFLVHAAREQPGLRVTMTRGSIEMQLRQLRERVLDAILIDVGSLPPAPDLVAEEVARMRAGFVCRSGHPLLADGRRDVAFDDILRYPLASTPLSDEMAHVLMRHFGPQANPEQAVSLRCEDVTSLIEAVRLSDAVFLGIVAAASAGIASGALAELTTNPPLAAHARYALVGLAGRTESPSIALFRRFMADRLRD